MKKTNKIGGIGLLGAAASLGYIISFFVFGANDSDYFSRANNLLGCQIYGGVLFLIGLVLMFIIFGKDNLLYFFKTETGTLHDSDVLDDDSYPQKHQINNPVEFKIFLLLNLFHLTCCLFFIFGRALGFSYAVVVVLAFVYAIIWMILGIIFQSMWRE